MKKSLIAISVAINVLMITAAIWVFNGGATSILLERFIAPFQERLVSQFEVLPVVAGDLVFLGDSITEGGLWNELFPDVNSRNRGVGGDVTEGVLARLDPIISGQPGKVFLLIGTNDLAFGIPEDEVLQNIETIVDRIDSGSPDTQVFVQSVLPREASYRARVESLNAKLEERVEGKAVWVDLYSSMLDERDGSLLDAYTNDELHLTGEGYIVWRDLIARFVESTISEPG